jgi:hypothetical protein
LRIAFLLQVPSSACTRFKWEDISVLFQRTPNLEPAFWRTGSVSGGEYKDTSRPLQVPQPGKFPLHWVKQFPFQNYISHHVGGCSLMWWEI